MIGGMIGTVPFFVIPTKKDVTGLPCEPTKKDVTGLPCEPTKKDVTGLPCEPGKKPLGVVHFPMFFLIRNATHSKVLGIVNEHEVLESSEIDQAIARYTKHGMLESYRKGNVMPAVLINIIRLNLNLRHWVWESISQAEFETYRDLHGFKVFTRPIVLEDEL